MQKKSLIKKNILHYIEFKGISRYQFYQLTGITRGILDQNNGMSEENTAKFLAYAKDINVEWLITGRGNMLIADNGTSLDNELSNKAIHAFPENDMIYRFGQLIELNLELAQQNRKLLEILEGNIQKHHIVSVESGALK